MTAEVVLVSEKYAFGVIVVAHYHILTHSDVDLTAFCAFKVISAWLTAFDRVEEYAHSLRIGFRCAHPIEIHSHLYIVGMMGAEFLVGAGTCEYQEEQ
jgi:hypothetical protein